MEHITHLYKYTKYFKPFESHPVTNVTVLSLVTYCCCSDIYISKDIKSEIVRMFLKMYYTNRFWTSSIYPLISANEYYNNTFNVTIPMKQKKAFMIYGNFPIQIVTGLFLQWRSLNFGFTIKNGNDQDTCDAIDPGNSVNSVSYGIMLIKDKFNMEKLLKEKKIYNRRFLDTLKEEYNIDTVLLDYKKGTRTLYYRKKSCNLLYDDDGDNGICDDDDLWVYLYGLDHNNLGINFVQSNVIMERPSSPEKKIYEKISIKDVTHLLFFIYVTETSVSWYEKPTEVNGGIFSSPIRNELVECQSAYGKDKRNKRRN